MSIPKIKWIWACQKNDWICVWYEKTKTPPNQKLTDFLTALCREDLRLWCVYDNSIRNNEVGGNDLRLRMWSRTPFLVSNRGPGDFQTIGYYLPFKVGLLARPIKTGMHRHCRIDFIVDLWCSQFLVRCSCVRFAGCRAVNMWLAFLQGVIRNRPCSFLFLWLDHLTSSNISIAPE